MGVSALNAHVEDWGQRPRCTRCMCGKRARCTCCSLGVSALRARSWCLATSVLGGNPHHTVGGDLVTTGHWVLLVRLEFSTVFRAPPPPFHACKLGQTVETCLWQTCRLSPPHGLSRFQADTHTWFVEVLASAPCMACARLKTCGVESGVDQRGARLDRVLKRTPSVSQLSAQVPAGPFCARMTAHLLRVRMRMSCAAQTGRPPLACA
eukprot:364671-Chlamydomonas_euryale.AAC.2